MCACTQQTVPYRIATQTATFSNSCVSYLEHLRRNLSDLIQKKLRKELTKFQISNFKNHWKSKFKMPEFEKEEKLGREKAMSLKETLCYEAFMRPQSFYVSQILKNELKTNNSSHLITKTRFRTRCFSRDKKIHSFVATNVISCKYHQNWCVVNTSFTFWI